jgi:signal transduction histidine kinase
VDLIVPAEMIEDVVAVVRESVTNVVRHARATHTDVGIQVDEDHVTIRIDDDGIGYAPRGRASGTANIAARADRLGGSSSIRSRDTGGTAVLWRVPLRTEQP